MNNAKPTVTSSFAAQANAFKVDYDAGHPKIASGGRAATATVSYDAASDSFKIAADANESVVTLTSSVSNNVDIAVNNSGLVLQSKADDVNGRSFEIRWPTGSEWLSTTKYVAIGQLVTGQREKAIGLDHYSAVDFAFGFPTLDATVPRSGGATYVLSMIGTRSSNARDTLLEMQGQGMAVVNFATGQLELTGFTNVQDNFHWVQIEGNESGGLIKASGALESGLNRFSGTFTAQAGSTQYAGNFSGSFYGPNAEDIGGTFYGAAGQLYYSLAFAGYSWPKTNADDTIANLKGTTRLQTVDTVAAMPGSSFVVPNTTNQKLGEGVIYDADKGTYTLFPFGGYNGSTQNFFYFSFGPADRTPNKDSTGVVTYAVEGLTGSGKDQSVIGVLDSRAAGIELTYTSFARTLSTHIEPDGTLRGKILQYIDFGRYTPPDQLPKTGSATYAGRLFGDIYDDVGVVASLVGQSSLSANFATGAINTSLSPIRVDANGNQTALGTYDFAGSIDAFLGRFDAAWTAGTGHVTGRFYGDKAQEYGAVFDIEDSVNGKMIGAALGKR